MVQRRAENEDEIDSLPQQNIVDAICRERNVEVESCRGRVLIRSAPDGLHSKPLEGARPFRLDSIFESVICIQTELRAN